jgi:DNA sulfur modification protein DndC
VTGEPYSAFAELGLGGTVDSLTAEIRALYLEDEVPWVVGYSGGKDSTAVLQLVWQALSGLEKDQRKKTVHVISTDTLVENPIVALWVANSLELMRTASEKDDLPIQPHRLTPAVKDTFWVNLIGKGYPAPRRRFRWCTDRLKISPSNQFIMDVVRTNGEAILVLGTRKAESSKRSAVMTDLERHRIRDRLSPNARLPNCLVYSPVEDWSNDDVWTFLMQTKNPWGNDNKNLLGMYQGATADGDCPLVVDESTPSCGNSRFGCWVCTLVEEDKSMTAMIQNDDEKKWMRPLLKLRNKLDDKKEEPAKRDFRRLTGKMDVRLNDEGDLLHVRGPYTQSAREDWLRRVLEAQGELREMGPAEVREIELITIPEIEEIRRIWVEEKHEIEDRVPVLFEDVTGTKYPGRQLDRAMTIGREEVALLDEVCGEDRMQYEMVRDLLDTEQGYRSKARRAGLYEELEETVARNFYDNEEDAVSFEKTNREYLARLRQDHGLLHVQPVGPNGEADAP